MSVEELRQRAERGFKPVPHDGSQAVPDYERRAREVRQKMQYLRELRLAKQREEISRRDLVE